MKLRYSLFLLVVLIACSNSNCLFEKIVVDKSINDSLFFTNKYIINPLTVLTENGVYDGFPDSTRYLLSSTLKVNNNPYWKIRLAEAKKNGDTVLIHISETNASLHHDLRINLINNKFSTMYSFKESGPFINNNDVKTITKELVFKQFPIQTGDTAYAKFSYRGICFDYSDEEFKIEGYFKVKWP